MALADIAKDRRLWIVLAAVGLILAARASGLAEFLSLDTLRQNRGSLTAWVGANMMLAGLAYIGIYIVAVALSLPGAVFLTLAGGFLFGAVLGTFYTVIAATLGATLVFVFAKALLGDSAIDRFGDQARKLAEGIRRNAASYLLVLRLVPLFPFFLVNLVPAFVGVRLTVFAVTTFVGIIPGTAVFSLAGAGLGSVLDQGGTVSIGSILTPEIIAGLIGLAALSLAGIPIRKWLDSQGKPGESRS